MATKQLNVYRINEYEWWVAYSLAEAIAACAHACGLPEDEAADEPYKLTVADLKTHFMLDEDGTSRRSFAEALQEYRDDYPQMAPCPFAGYE